MLLLNVYFVLMTVNLFETVIKRYLKKKRIDESSSNVGLNIEHTHAQEEVNLDDLISDSGLRKSIYEYDPNDRERVRRAYLQKGPCQPKNHDFSRRQCENNKQKFQGTWFNEYSNWLEYSIEKKCSILLILLSF